LGEKAHVSVPQKDNDLNLPMILGIIQVVKYETGLYYHLKIVQWSCARERPGSNLIHEAGCLD